MANELNQYQDNLTKSVFNDISDYFLINPIDADLIEEHFTKRMKKKQFADFQEYYFKTLNNPEEIIFKEFKQKYSIQGVDENSTKELQINKEKIIQLITENKLSELYFNHFAKVEIKHKDTFKEKNLGSFFTKIVHTFRPNDYTPLDIPIRNYFGLAGESYFISLIVVSNAYKMWADKNKERMKNLKDHLEKTNYKFLRLKDESVMKLLNLIFWSVADNEKRTGSR